jgi:hypothetical protein
MTILRVDNWKDTNNFAYNNIVQVQHVHYATYEAYAGSARVASATGLVLSITPRYNTSKILVLCSPNVSHATSSSVCSLRVLRTGPSTAYSPNSSGADSGQYTLTNYINPQGTAGNETMGPNFNIHWLDSPTTTSTCTYRLEIANNTTGQAIYLNGNGEYTSSWQGSSQMTLMEIKQ